MAVPAVPVAPALTRICFNFGRREQTQDTFYDNLMELTAFSVCVSDLWQPFRDGSVRGAGRFRQRRAWQPGLAWISV